MGHITVKQLMARAVGKEQEAFAFYQGAARIVNNPGTRQMLLELAEEELKHKMRLEALDLDKMDILAKGEITDLGIEKYLDQIPASPEMSPSDALRLAMKEEEEAHKFYLYLAESVNNPEAKTLAEALAPEELRHKVRLEKMWNDEVLKDN